MYRILWDKKALADLKSIQHPEAIKIVQKVESYLSQDPFKLGKPLQGNFKGLYRYRFGKYRIIYEVNNMNISIIVVRVGHRSEVYNL
jgi:mRNA interferase RelE/StbE